MEWRKIEGFPKYSVSDEGMVRNDETGKILKPDICNGGYLRVTLCKDGKTTRKMLHRLVAEMFIPNKDNKTQVNHIDGNKQNNALFNLEWVTRSENEQHKYRVLKVDQTKYNHHKRKVFCVDTGVVYDGVKEAARAIGVHHSSMTSCLRGRTYTCAGYRWKYAEAN